MSLRIYLCPVIGDGLSTQTAFRAKLSGLAPDTSAIIPHSLDGTPKFNWALAVARAANWASVDADIELQSLFGIDLPDLINTWAELKGFLLSKTVADIPPARRQAINNKLIAKGIDTSSITLSTTWWQVLRLVVTHLNSGVPPDGDAIGIA